MGSLSRMRIQSAVHRTTGAAQVTFPYLPLTGINAAGNNICFAAAQVGMLWMINGNGWNTTGFQNNSNWAAVFQEYRITEYSVEMFISINTATAPTSLSSGDYFPMAYWVIDREDDLPVNSATQALQYATVKVTQLGSLQGSKSVTLSRPSISLGAINASTQVGALAAGSVERSPWLPCGTNSNNGTPTVIPHGYIKLFVDNLGSSLSTSMLNITFILRATHEYRGID
jgi:hypothetical protein